ncbi:hypothetical protein ANN_14747 [Periplaneta americana]|uniref:Uncharacterized protein n=1 Tax=Periplaneta americana TaxID=6978 RepID=A0ABQ8SZA3_PERAM|nr:hypothetical protein ANN_14747 [Periplaneta americana]
MAGLCEGDNEPAGFLKAIYKGSDLLEEAGQCSGEPRTSGSSSSSSGLKELARSLKQHLRGFSERLEDTRERLEDTSRCFYLLDKENEKELTGSLVEKKLPSEGYTGRNGEREKSSGQKKISDDRRH